MAKQQLTEFERAHAASILDENPILEPIYPAPKILIASVVRKPPKVVKAWLQSLQWQHTREPADISFAFIADTKGEPYHDEVLGLLTETPKAVVEIAEPSKGYESYREHTGITRGWSPDAWHRVGDLKNKLLHYAKVNGYDAIWLVDADVLCESWTLQSLLDSRAPIVSGVYWTFWSKRSELDAVWQHAGPQVWLRHPYTLSGRTWTEAGFRQALIDRQRVQVWGLGACTLISRAALEKGVSFAKVAELPPGPMSDGEDRHFCARADNLHIEMVADAWPDIYHAYHTDEYDQIDQMMGRLARPSTVVKPEKGDLISAVLTNLESPTTPPQWIRGRLGFLKVLPEVEEALVGLTPGERALERVHFPMHYPDQKLRGRTLTVQIDLLDAKPFRLPPTIDQELVVGSLGKAIDATTMTTDQLNDILEGAAAVKA